MAKDSGWIKLHRSSFDNQLYFAEPFTKWQAWCDLLLLANHKEGWVLARGIRVPVKRGQTGFSVVKLAIRWRWSRCKTNRFLCDLEKDNQIVQQKSNATTLISILNYSKYQDNDTAEHTANDTAERTAEKQQNVQQKDTNKNVKNKKNDNKHINNGTQFPEISDFNGLPEMTVNQAIQYISITKRVDLTKPDIDGLWELFKTKNLTGKKFYQNEGDVYSHFLESLKYQKFEHGIFKQPIKQAGKGFKSDVA